MDTEDSSALPSRQSRPNDGRLRAISASCGRAAISRRGRWRLGARRRTLTTRFVFVSVMVEEFAYASGHPYAYGPAKVIAWGAGAGAVLSLAVGLLAFSLTRDSGWRSARRPKSQGVTLDGTLINPAFACHPLPGAACAV